MTSFLSHYLVLFEFQQIHETLHALGRSLVSDTASVSQNLSCLNLRDYFLLCSLNVLNMFMTRKYIRGLQCNKNGGTA